MHGEHAQTKVVLYACAHALSDDMAHEELHDNVFCYSGG